MIVEIIKKKLTDKIDASHLEIVDESHKHAGHAQSSGGHFRLHIVSEDFSGLSLIERHRLIYAALGDMIQNEIHALSINAKTESEI
tara:strand:+ start:64 stop:321 length:258 start_codon:yes stop_codon:yes gene_type:complete